MACKVVCISHATGAGGEEVGRLVAERLGFGYVDEEIVANAAARGGLEPADIADEERRKSLAARLLDAMAHGGGEAWAIGGAAPLVAGEEWGGDEVRALIRETIEHTAARAVKDADANRRDYLRRFYEVDEELPTHYDLVVNTDVLSPEQCAEVVSSVAGSA